MIEIMIAMSVAIVGLVGVISFISNSIGLSRVATEQYAGSNLASEGLELVKNIIGRNKLQNLAWDNGLSLAGDYQMDYNDTILAPYSPAQKLLFNSGAGIYSYDSGTATKFNRKITLERVGADEIRAVSLVSWTGRGGAAFQASVEALFFNHQ